MKQPGVGLGVFVFRSRDSNEIAWGLRKNALGAGTWSLAGGHLEFDETFEQCAIRETKEETGLDIEDVRFLTALETFWDWQGKRYHYVTIFMTAIAKAREDGAEPELQLMEPDKSDGWCWRSLKEGAKLDASRESKWTFFEPIKNFIDSRKTLMAWLDDSKELYKQSL